MTTTTIRKLVVTSLVTGIVQADGLLESLPLPPWVIQFVRAGIELAFIGSASALAYEAGAYGWKLATRPKAPKPQPSKPQPDGNQENQILGKLDEIRTTLLAIVTPKQEAGQSQQPTTITGVTDAQESKSEPDAQSSSIAAPQTQPKPKGQRLQPGATAVDAAVMVLGGQ